VSVPSVLDVASLLALLGESREAALSFYRGKSLEGRLTYAELAAGITSVAASLHEAYQVAPGDRVAILAHNRLEVPVLVLALLRLGAIAVPLNPASSPAEMAFILRHSGARGLCSTNDLAALVPEEARPEFMFAIEDAFACAASAAPPCPEGLSNRLGVVLYTSGTTGTPKGVGLCQSSLFHNAFGMAHNFGLRKATQLAVLPLYHAHAFGFGLMTALSTGGHLVFTERLEPFTWANVIRDESILVTSVVPTMLPMLLLAGVTREKVPSLRHILVSSAPLAANMARDFETKTNIPLVLGWGLSEYTNFACCVSPEEPPESHAELLYSEEVPSIGPAIAGAEVRVVDAKSSPVGERTRGELVVRGPSRMQGYFADPKSTATAIDSAGFLHTGDEGFYVLRGGRPVFFVTGRLKEIIIRDAEKYSPLGLERRITEALPELSGRLVVLGFPHEAHGEEVGAYLECSELEDAVRSRLLRALDALPLGERPKVVLFGASPIPRTHTGKIQRRRMQPWFASFAKHKGGVVIRSLVEP
jgi:long-chain acyl-CoA synthetase